MSFSRESPTGKKNPLLKMHSCTWL